MLYQLQKPQYFFQCELLWDCQQNIHGTFIMDCSKHCIWSWNRFVEEKVMSEYEFQIHCIGCVTLIVHFRMSLNITFSDYSTECYIYLYNRVNCKLFRTKMFLLILWHFVWLVLFLTKGIFPYLVVFVNPIVLLSSGITFLKSILLFCDMGISIYPVPCLPFNVYVSLFLSLSLLTLKMPLLFNH